MWANMRILRLRSCGRDAALLFAGDTRDEREAQALSRHLSRGRRRTRSATGHAWMMTMSDQRALELVSRTGFVGESREDAI
jgi:hypothetical protein